MKLSMSSSSSGSQRRSHDWLELPRDLMAAILQKLSPPELLEGAHMVCKTWWNISKDEPSLWRSIDSFQFKGNNRSRKEMMIMRAIDLSCGKLVDAKIEGHELVLYTAERSSQLRRLEVHRCEPYYLAEAVKKLPSLEELHVVGEMPSKPILEIIGSSCSHLKSLKLVKDMYWGAKQHTNDEEAEAIGRTMTRLQHLELDGEMLTESGLKAILDGCPHLLSLTLFDAGRCAFVPTLAKRYPARITCKTLIQFELCSVNAYNYDYYGYYESDSE